MRLKNMILSMTAAMLFTAPALAQEDHSGPAAGAADAEHASGGHELKTPPGGWTHEGFFGTYDQNQLQRGYKVYREICASCHGMKLMSFRNLGQKGGPFYDAEFPNPNDNPVVKALAAEITLPAIDQETGDPITAPAIPANHFPEPFANEFAARAGNGGALPPDLSVIVKAREGGAGYIYSLLTGYYEPPTGLEVAPGQNYNAYFHGDTAAQWTGDPRLKPPGGFLAMAAPLSDDLVTYDDGTPATLEQHAADVSAYLAWASEPKMQTRKQMGLAAIAYLAILALLVYLSYRRIWRNVEH